MQNALDNLAGSADLISVRGRATFTRPFERVEKLRRTADERFRAKEQELEQQLRDTEEKLTALQSKERQVPAALLVTPEQEKEIEHFQDGEAAHPQGAARGARRSRRRHQEPRHALKVINIVVVPVLFALVALALAAWRRQRRRAAPMKESLT